MGRVDYSVLNIMGFSVLAIRGCFVGLGGTLMCCRLTVYRFSPNLYRLGMVVLTSYPFPRLLGGVSRCKPLSSQLTWTSFQNLVEHGQARNKRGLVTSTDGTRDKVCDPTSDVLWLAL